METSVKKTILIADDNPNNLKVISEALTGFGYNVRVALDGKAALESAFAQTPDLVLLDIHMPEMDGYEACQALKNDPRTSDIPVIFVSAMNEAFNKVKAFEYGAVDYLVKPIQVEETKARVEVHLALKTKIKELEEFNRILVDREMRLIELKNEVNHLHRELGRSDKYPEVWEKGRKS